MLAGLRGSSAGAFAFFDADLVGLTAEHVWLTIEHFSAGFDQVLEMRVTSNAARGARSSNGGEVRGSTSNRSHGHHKPTPACASISMQPQIHGLRVSWQRRRACAGNLVRDRRRRDRRGSSAHDVVLLTMKALTLATAPTACSARVMSKGDTNCTTFQAIESAAAQLWPGLRLRCRTLSYGAPDDGRVAELREHEGRHLGSVEAPGVPASAELRVEIVVKADGRYVISADLDEGPIAEDDPIDPHAARGFTAIAEALVAQLRTKMRGSKV